MVESEPELAVDPWKEDYKKCANPPSRVMPEFSEPLGFNDFAELHLHRFLVQGKVTKVDQVSPGVVRVEPGQH